MSPPQAVAALDTVAPWGYTGRVSLRLDGSIASRCQTGTNVAALNGDLCYNDINDFSGNQQKMVLVPRHCSAIDNTLEGSLTYWMGQPGETFPYAVGGSESGGEYEFVASGSGFNAIPGNSNGDISQAFIVDNKAKPWIFVSSYEGSVNASYHTQFGGDILESVAGVAPATAITPATARADAERLGPGWECMTIQILAMLQTMTFVEYGTYNLQFTLGQGNTGPGGLINTGATVSNGNASVGNVDYASSNAVSVRGWENGWGNVNKFLEGINVNACLAYIAPQTRLQTYACNRYTTPYVSTGDSIPNGGFSYDQITSMFANPADIWAFLPSAAAPSLQATSYLCSQFVNTQASGSAAVWQGGQHGNYSTAGLCYFMNSVSSNTAGARLCFLPP
jgi:hypothetical protein